MGSESTCLGLSLRGHIHIIWSLEGEGGSSKRLGVIIWGRGGGPIDDYMIKYDDFFHFFQYIFIDFLVLKIIFSIFFKWFLILTSKKPKIV